MLLRRIKKKWFWLSESVATIEIPGRKCIEFAGKASLRMF